ncbi:MULTISPECIES: glycoside hydrolase family 25 protein [Sphingobacterium]|uniref:Glycoside hydrolase family 25 protein n=1 Tax=Sphingobacterium populi TaxID=1812824 RepID=A0ABW5UFD0_9SPHI|nr:GH25 family lysozyme [Sphingobacterium sp. CFCC 11742]
MPAPRRTRKQHVVSTKKERLPYLLWSILIPLILILLIGAWHYRTGIIYYLKTVISTAPVDEGSNKKHDARNIFLMSQHQDYTFGIDISHYQGRIMWDSIRTINDRFPLDFIFIRATMGEQGKDREFKNNWLGASAQSKIKGAYHYYRPNENSIKQAKNFIRQVTLQPGDLPPVLDIEELPRNQSLSNLQKGLKRWLTEVEKHYNVKPILYSGDSYYTDFLEREFSDYVLWIANYNFWVESPKKHWDFWQFSEKGSVNGIATSVDLNMFKGSIEQLEQLCLPF